MTGFFVSEGIPFRIGYPPGTLTMKECSAEYSIITYQKVRNFLKDLGEETVGEKDEEKFWKLDVRHGSTLITIYHDKRLKYMSVVYPNSIQDREILTVINAAFNDEKRGAERRFAFYSAVSSPSTGYLMYTNENGFTGYDIFAKIFPFEPGFSLPQMDEAIQRVVSVGILGTVYLKSLLPDSNVLHKIVENDSARGSSGDIMYC